MQVQINAILTNGMIDAMKAPHVPGFIIGALDNGFSVRMPGAIIAFKNKVHIMTHAQGDDLKVTIIVGQEIKHSMPANDWDWCDLTIRRGNIYYGTTFISKTLKA